MRKYRNQILLGLVIALLFYVVLLLVMDNQGQLTGEVLKLFPNYPWLLLFPLVIVKFISWFFRFLEWQYYLQVIKARDKISLFDNVVVYLSGYSFAVSPGKIAEILKSVILKVKTGVPVAKSAPVVIAERVVDGVAVIIVAVLAFVLAGDNIHLGDYGYLLIVSAVLLAAGLIAVQIAPLAHFFLNIVAHIPVINRIHQPLSNFYESSREVFHLKHVVPTTVLGAIAYIGDAICFVIILYGFGFEPTWILFLQATFIVGVAAAIGALSGVPNGAGVTEISTGAMLLAIIAPQQPEMTPAVASAAALLEGFFHKWFRVLVGALVAVIFRQRLFTPSVVAAIDEMESDQARIHYQVESSQAS